jgi:putative inorganic carbon (HCO3(-)) transporter
VLLAAAIATRSPLLIGLALAPPALALIARPERALVVFAFGFYLNLPVLAAHDSHLSSGLASAFALLLLSPFLIYVAGERRPLVVTPALPAMIGYLVLLVLSATLAGGARASTVAPVMTFLSEGLLLYLLVTNAIRTPGQLRAVIWTVMLAGAFMGLISVWQELTHAYHQTLGGLAQVDSTGFNVGSGLSGKELRPRLAGPIGEKNRYAQVLLVLLPLAVSRMRAERSPRLRVLAGGCAGLILCGVVLSFSRGAAVAALILVLAAAMLRLISLRQLVAILAVVATLVALVAPDYVTRLQSLGSANSALSQQSSGVDAAIQGRATENVAALHVFRDHPLLGVGPGQFFNRYSAQYGNALDLRFLEQNRRAHNLYLEIAADTGLLGLGAFLTIVGLTLVGLRRLAGRCRARSPGLASLGDALLAALIAYLASGLFLQLAYKRYFWFLIALANAAIWMLGREATRDQRTPLRAL